MVNRHWFDALNKRLTFDTPRRGVLRALAAWVLAESVAAANATAKNGGHSNNKGNGNSNRKGKNNRNRNGNRNGDQNATGTGTARVTVGGSEPTPPLPQTCSGGSCVQEWAGIDSEIAYCEFICEQCDGDDAREFCIAEGDPNDPSKIAVCCDLPAPHCCDAKCTDRQLDEINCGICGKVCDPGEFCNDGSCVPVCRDQNCPPGQGCITTVGYLCNGQPTADCQCGCGPGLAYCQHPQLGWVCASGNASFC